MIEPIKIDDELYLESGFDNAKLLDIVKDTFIKIISILGMKSKKSARKHTGLIS